MDNQEAGLAIKKYFQDFLSSHFAIKSKAKLTVTRKTIVYTFEINQKIEKFIVEYHATYQKENVVLLSTTVSEDFLYEVCSTLLSMDLKNPNERFEILNNMVSTISGKYKFFNNIESFTENGLFYVKHVIDKKKDITYYHVMPKRIMTLTVNQNLYATVPPKLFVIGRIFFKFSNGRIETEYQIFSNAIEERQMLTGTMVKYNNMIKKSKKLINSLIEKEGLLYISKEFNIPMETLFSMTEEELKPYTDIFTMVKI